MAVPSPCARISPNTRMGIDAGPSQQYRRQWLLLVACAIILTGPFAFVEAAFFRPFSTSTRTVVPQSQSQQGALSSPTDVSADSGLADSFPAITSLDDSLPAWLGKLTNVDDAEELAAALRRGQRFLENIEQKQGTTNSHIGACFREAAKALKAGCSSVHSTDEEKIEYAVRLTNCEIRTASVEPPPECENGQKFSIKKCIEIYASSAQLWTSYSGYLRDVMTMCLAVRHAVERELLVELHSNITLGQLAQYRLLLQQLQDFARWRQHEEAYQNGLREARDELGVAFSGLKDLGASLRQMFQSLLLDFKLVDTGLAHIADLQGQIQRSSEKNVHEVSLNFRQTFETSMADLVDSVHKLRDSALEAVKEVADHNRAQLAVVDTDLKSAVEAFTSFSTAESLVLSYMKKDLEKFLVLAANANAEGLADIKQEFSVFASDVRSELRTASSLLETLYDNLTVELSTSLTSFAETQASFSEHLTEVTHFLRFLNETTLAISNGITTILSPALLQPLEQLLGNVPILAYTGLLVVANTVTTLLPVGRRFRGSVHLASILISAGIYTSIQTEWVESWDAGLYGTWVLSIAIIGMLAREICLIFLSASFFANHLQIRHRRFGRAGERPFISNNEVGTRLRFHDSPDFS
ncbi:hypothetical protein DFJ73DRAFT_807870 [Zopfochytrium polystomum]|nr:hypothetical protein DFJ73DRAFT_807870 [Zopfochytrium polystomum]